MLKGMNVPLHDALVTLSVHVKSKKSKQRMFTCARTHTNMHTKRTTSHGSKKAHTQMHAANEADEE